MSPNHITNNNFVNNVSFIHNFLAQLLVYVMNYVAHRDKNRFARTRKHMHAGNKG